MITHNFIDEMTYVNLSASTVPKIAKEVVCDHPTGVVSGKGEITATIVEITPHPPYGTMTFSKHNDLNKHASRMFLNNLKPSDAIVKLDFSNAFNSIRRDKMLEAVQEICS